MVYRLCRGTQFSDAVQGHMHYREGVNMSMTSTNGNIAVLIRDGCKAAVVKKINDATAKERANLFLHSL